MLITKDEFKIEYGKAVSEGYAQCSLVQDYQSQPGLSTGKN